MKKFFSAVLIALVVTFSANCSARESVPVPVTHLNTIVGNWYDAKGNLVLTISNDYKINGCTVLSVKAHSGTYEIQIDEGNRYRTLELALDGSFLNIPGYQIHQILIVNWGSSNAYALRRTKEPHYFESVGGIYLGMDKDDVIKLYGQPSSVDNKRGTTWKYDNLGLDVHFQYNLVTGITIYPYGDRRFDWSGLSARSSVADFEYKYNSKVSSRGNINIGHGELIRLNKIRFGNNGVYLGIYTWDYVF